MTAPIPYTVERARYDDPHPLLGRHIEHDSRSRAYAYPADAALIASIRHDRYVPVFDQGQVGSCTGNASVGNLGTGVFWATVKALSILSTTSASACESVAVSVYSDAEDIDGDGPYPPNDNGSTGLSVAKVLKARGWINGYQHCFAFGSVLTALSKQPVIVGTNWTEDMFDPDSDGRLRPTGSVEGGHEYVLDQIDVENQRVWMQNSWGTGWGVDGRAYFTYDDLSTLLAAHGDCTVFTPLTVPAPVPTPDPAAAFVTAANEWLSHPHTSAVNKALVRPLRDYLATLH